MIAHPSHPTNRYSPPLLAAALACGLASVWLQLPASGGWLASWSLLTDAFVSAWILLFAAALASLWGIQALGAALGRFNGLKRTSRGLGWDTRRTGREPADQVATERGRLPWWWALLLLAVCTAELMTHAGERNGFLATSRPESGVETWTNAEGYATLMDGMLAQGDGLFLLSLVKLFLGEGPPGPGEFDRRAGHLFLVALLQRPFGTYWAFAVTNLLSWWAATLAVWWLGQRRWPGTLVPWVASALAATGLGFAFMVAAPQPHAVAFGAFALVLLLADRAQLWEARPSLTAGTRVGWAAGAAGLIYFVHLPALLFLWLYRFSGVRPAGGTATSGSVAGAPTPLRGLGVVAVATVVCLAIVSGWERYAAALLGLNFSGGNNDYAAEAVKNWLGVAAQGPVAVLNQLHLASLRGILVGAFYYPWWLLAALGVATSPREARRWAVAVLLAAAVPAIAFSIRFQLPRLAYFMYPAVYLLAAQGIEVIASRLAGRPGRRTWLVAALLVLALAAVSNADLTGWQQLNVWFHYAQGNTW